MTQAQPQNDSEPEVQVDSQVEETNNATDEVAPIGHNEPPEEAEFDPKQRVDFSTPEQQKKFNDIYKQAKMSDARNKMQADMLAKAMEKINELESRFSQTDHAEAERILNARLKEARDLGDEEKADRILQEIIDFRVDSKLKATKAEKPLPQTIDQIDDPDVKAIVNYANETDVRGQPIRPWIDANHPQHANAMKIASTVALEVNSEFGYVDIPEVMKRMDNAMKPKQQTQANSRAPDPMRGNLTNRPAQGKMKLSPQELAAAQKLGVKPEDYLKWKR